MKKILLAIFFISIALFGFGQSYSLQCYSGITGNEFDCPGCGIKNQNFNGIILKNRKKSYALWLPVRVRNNDNMINFEDAFGEQILLNINKIKGYSTMREVYDFINHCAEGDSIVITNIYNSNGIIPSGETRVITSEGGEGIKFELGLSIPPTQINFRKVGNDATMEFEQNFNTEGTLQSKNSEFLIKARESLRFNSPHHEFLGNTFDVNVNDNIFFTGRQIDFNPVEDVNYTISDNKKVSFKNNDDYGIRLIANNTDNNKFHYKDETGNYRSLQFGFVLGDVTEDYDDITLIGRGFNDNTIITTNTGNLQIGCFNKDIIFNSSLSSEAIFKDGSNKHGLLYSGFGENDATNSNNTADYSTLVNSSLVPKAYVDNAIANASGSSIYTEDGSVNSLRTVTGEKIIFNNKGIDIKNGESEILKIMSTDFPSNYLYFTTDYYGNDYSLIYKDGETNSNLIIGYQKYDENNKHILLGNHINIKDNGAFIINDSNSDDSYALKVNGFNNTSIVQFKTNSGVVFDLSYSETDIKNRIRTQGSIRRKIETVTSDKTVYGIAEHIIICNTSSQPINITLHTLSEKDGTVFVIKDSGNAGTNNITITTASGKYIDNNNSLTIANNYDTIKLIYSSSENQWFKI